MRDLDQRQLGRSIERVVRQLCSADFRSAEVKKLRGHDLYRARLDDKNRLLFRFGKCGDTSAILILEVVHNHAYDKARFLNGGSFSETDFEPVSVLPREGVEMRLLPPTATAFHMLDKPLCFDEAQEAVYDAPLPLIMIGSAGSGKTALTLEKLKTLPGSGLYLTRSQYLVESARALYSAHGYENKGQEVEFLSLKELVETIAVPEGREATWVDFAGWFARVRGATRTGDVNKIYEEIKGVITGAAEDTPHLDLETYLQLGVRQSIFLGDERRMVFSLFERWKQHMAASALYDANMLAWSTRAKANPTYDFLVIDEVQDITTVELRLAFSVLKEPRHFILSGDSNQIVHPNLFSWARLKSVFHEGDRQGSPLDHIHILSANYRNTQAVTAIANRLLLVKQKRFGSIDKESNYLVECTTNEQGTVELVADRPEIRREIDEKTRRSTKFAVIVLRDEDKPVAHQAFSTPLVFSVHESKGLEYENVILFNLISTAPREFRECCAGVEPADLEGDLVYARARDKTDKSLDAYKFYVNALYVAMTRAVRTLYLVESEVSHPLFALLAIRDSGEKLEITKEDSSQEDWQREARKLELQGKTEQAEQIRREVLGEQPVPWEVTSPASYADVAARAFGEGARDKNCQQRVFEYAVTNGVLSLLPRLVQAGFRHAKRVESGIEYIERTHYKEYLTKHSLLLQAQIRRHGINHRNPLNETPLMVAARVGRGDLVREFLAAGADPRLLDSSGHTAWRLALQSWRKKSFTKPQVLVELHRALSSEPMKVKVGARMMKLDPRSFEWFLLNLLLVDCRANLAANKSSFPFPLYRSATLAEAMSTFPDAVVPPHRKKQGYVSAMLAKNDVWSSNPYTKRLLLRVRHGVYSMNPMLELDRAGQWVRATDLLEVPHLLASLGDEAATLRSWLEKNQTELAKLLASE